MYLSFESNLVSGFEIISLLHQGQVVMSVCPELGGKLTGLDLMYEGQKRQILWEVTPDDLEKKQDFGKNDLLFPFPNRLADGRYSWEGVDYQFLINEPDRNNAIHGFIRERAFSVLDKTIEGSRATMDLVCDFEGEAHYPFPCRLCWKYQWSAGAGFRVDFIVENKGLKPMPFGLGWHPYFMTTSEATLHIPQGVEHLTDARTIPVREVVEFEPMTLRAKGELFNKTFEIRDTPIYQLKTNDAIIEVRNSANLPFLQAFVPKGKPVIAIEPMTCGINALQTGEHLLKLSPGEKFEGYTEVGFKD